MYRLTLDDDSTAIVYIWDDAENYWPITQADETENQSYSRISQALGN